MTARKKNLVSINQTSSDEISSCLQPKHPELRFHILEQGPHAVDPDKSVYSKCGREDVGQCFPYHRLVGTRPGYSRNEQKRKGREYHDEHAVLPVPHENAYSHGKEYAG